MKYLISSTINNSISIIIMITIITVITSIDNNKYKCNNLKTYFYNYFFFNNNKIQICKPTEISKAFPACP